MIIFGGFNGEYYNDLYYINAFELKSRIQIPASCRQKSIKELINNKNGSDGIITSKEGNQIFIHKGLLSNGFKNHRDMQKFIQESSNIDEQSLLEVIKKIYIGYGEIDEKIASKYEINISSCEEDYEEELL